MYIRNIRAAISLLLSILLCLQTYSQKATNYDAEWKKVDEFVKKGLSKSAFDLTNRIFTSAKKDNNDVQIIKALIIRININSNIEQNVEVTNIKAFEKEAETAKEPAKSILYSILGEMYWHYFQQKRWQLYNRTKTEGFKKEDINTWTSDDFHKRIGELYLLSLKNEEPLKKSSLDPFEAIIIKGTVRHLRPTLYDLLAHRGLDYFKNDERDITKPAYAFEINDEKAFAPASEFVNHQFVNKDSSSLHYKAILIFQKLLAFHAVDIKPDALIDADIERIEFMKQYGVMENKSELYMKALQQLAMKHNSPASAQATFLVAKEIYDRTNEKVVYDTSKYSLRKAKVMAESVASKYPDSEGGINARNLIKDILHKSVEITSERINIPNEPFRALIKYRNIFSIQLRVIKLTKILKEGIDNLSEEKIFKRLTESKYIKTWNQMLPLTEDYKEHSVEIKIDRLPIGEYAIIASIGSDFSLKNNALTGVNIYVSNISYINSGTEFFVLHRKTGHPLPRASVQVWENKKKAEFVSTDDNGYFKLKQKDDESRNIRLDILYDNDHLFLDDEQYFYQYNDDDDEDYSLKSKADKKDFEEDKSNTILFTDRGIYRPGQLVYFKGISVTKSLKTKLPKLYIIKDSIKVYLNDANSQKIDSLKVLMNEYGSIKGQFRLPENRMNGEFDIEVADFNNSSVSFSVEEYKRPKFYAELKKINDSYHLNDTIKVTGFALAYAGNNIDNAAVKYTVRRTMKYQYDWNTRKSYYSGSTEIAQGELNTDATGQFTIKFLALPDPKIERELSPVFDYNIEADITDINGETRNANTTIQAGYRALNMKVKVPSVAIEVDSLNQLSVQTKNLSDIEDTISVRVQIHKLEEPERLVRNRYWDAPDQYIMSEKEFLKSFPNDEYKEESRKETWEIGSLVYSESITSNSDFAISPRKFTEGWYIVEAEGKDKYGELIKDVKYFQLYKSTSNGLTSSQYFFSPTTHYLSAEPGVNVPIKVASPAEDIFMIQQQKTLKRGKAETKEFTFFNMNNEVKTFSFPISEKDRGGFGVYSFFIKENRFYYASWGVAVPWYNKDLNISFETFRDKMLPGSEEKWKVKISGNKSEKVAAEMLTTMYDASLDQIQLHKWEELSLWPTFSDNKSWSGNENFNKATPFTSPLAETVLKQKEKNYDELFPVKLSYLIGNVLAGKVAGVQIRSLSNLNEVVVSAGYSTKKNQTIQTLQFTSPKVVKGRSTDLSYYKTDSTKNTGAYYFYNEDFYPETSDSVPSILQIRKNFNETAFFYPELRTDKDGNIEFSFTMPEALTKWKLMALAHTKDLASGYTEKTVITQKDLMVQPNPPRFLREGDKIEFSAKVVNLSEKEIKGNAQLSLFNASTMNSVNDLFKNTGNSVPFTIAAGQSAAVKFSLSIPVNYNDAVVYRIVAKASPTGGGLEGASDGEEAAIPVLTNRMLVTEAMPLAMRGTGSKTFKLDKLLNSASTTLTNHALTIEYTTNPAWYAVQALPYLMEFPYECSEQTFNRFYANALASKIVSSSPKIKAVFQSWISKVSPTGGDLEGALQKNEELKSVLLQETPWVLEAKNEEQRKKNIGLLFDMARMSSQLESTLNKLTDLQTSNGGFAWFKGGRDDRYITQYIMTGIGHLKKLKALSKEQEEKLKPIISKALPYLDARLKEDYDYLIKYKIDLTGNNLNSSVIQYGYMHTFFPEYEINKNSSLAVKYYLQQEEKYWLKESKYMQAMIALTLDKFDLFKKDKKFTHPARDIIASLKENSINNEELGMYWKEWNTGGYWWYQAPIESQALMIEAFAEIDKDQKTIDDLKTWLLKNKQTNDWKTTKATADACYALLLQGTDWLSEEKSVSIKLGDTTIQSNQQTQEAGNGYFKAKIEGRDIKPSMGNITLTILPDNNKQQTTNNKPINLPSWGSVYWQYFENLDKITFAETPLKLSKRLFIETNTDRGPVLTPVNEGSTLKVGDKIKVRIELRVDRDMEYVHMKDMRGSCMEPVNVLSEYKYQDGLGYYETTKDASTNFFFDHLNKGTYVFEYPMFVTHSGDFSNGITSIQCMYAPEFTSHSEGVRIRVY